MKAANLNSKGDPVADSTSLEIIRNYFGKDIVQVISFLGQTCAGKSWTVAHIFRILYPNSKLQPVIPEPNQDVPTTSGYCFHTIEIDGKKTLIIEVEGMSAQEFPSEIEVSR